MASRYHEDWQSSKKTVLERNTYMFDNPLMSDISFTCGESSRVFHAHKYVLGTSSAVFYAMFYGDLAQKESTIRIPDAEEESFKEFLRFLYTDDCEISAENAIRVLYLAKKYLISSLADKCCKVLKKSIKPDNVFAVLEQAVQFDENDLEAKCWDIVSKNALESINSERFCDIGSHTLNALLKRETLGISEVELFKGVLTWVDNECARQGINIEEDNTARRRVVGDSVYEIRFLEMSQEDFAKYVSLARILTDAEVISIFRKFNGLDVPGLKWKQQEKRRSIVGFSRFEVAKVLSGLKWTYGTRGDDALALAVNKAVLFHGVRLFGSNGSQYQVSFTIKNEKVTGTYTSEIDNDGVCGYDVMLPKPISLPPNEDITIIATITGPQSQAGKCGKHSTKVDDIVVTFKDAPSGLSPNHTDKYKGQFYKIYLSEL